MAEWAYPPRTEAGFRRWANRVLAHRSGPFAYVIVRLGTAPLIALRDDEDLLIAAMTPALYEEFGSPSELIGLPVLLQESVSLEPAVDERAA